MNFIEIQKALVELDADRVKSLVATFLRQNCQPREILEKGLIPGMKEVGQRFTQKIYFVPEVLVASEAFYAGFALVSPLLVSETAPTKGKVVIGVVAGDIHDIGKNIVKVMLEASGFQIIDLGRDVPADRFVEAVVTEKPRILALSSLMTTTMREMAAVATRLKEKNLHTTTRLIVGGAPVTEDFARTIGADGYGEDAGRAVELVERLCRE